MKDEQRHMGYISNGIVFNHLKNGDLAIYYNIDIENIMLSEIIYTEKEKYCMISLICENQKRKRKKMKKGSSQVQKTNWWLPEMKG